MAWKVPKLWEGGEVWILGGGPSLPREFNVPESVIAQVIDKKLSISAYSPYMAPIHRRHVIAVNTLFKVGEWVDMVFWGDKKWYFNNRAELAKFKGLKVTCHQFFSRPGYAEEGIKCVDKDKSKSSGISDNPSMASWNANSGAAAISVAANMGASKIILVGFDMKLGDDKRQHCHSEYKSTAGPRTTKPVKLPFDRHLLGFPAIAKDAKKRGITIINASPNSAIPDFPKASVGEVIDGFRMETTAPVKRIVDGFKVMSPTEPGKRFDWLADVVKKRRYKIGVEVGVCKGRTARVVLARNKQLHLYVVDLWAPVPKKVGGGRQYKTWNFNRIRREFAKSMEPFRDRIKVLEGISWEVANQVPDNSLDFVFIDADHEYQSVVNDIEAWTPKLKPGGMISGHDTHFEGVLKALKELIPNFKRVGIDHCWEATKEDVDLNVIPHDLFFE